MSCMQFKAFFLQNCRVYLLTATIANNQMGVEGWQNCIQAWMSTRKNVYLNSQKLLYIKTSHAILFFTYVKAVTQLVFLHRYMKKNIELERNNHKQFFSLEA